MMASAASPHWEVVGKGKKSRIPTPVSKTEKRKMVENMPKIEPNPPLKEEASMYDVFLEKEKKQQSLSQVKTDVKDSSKTNGTVHTSKKPAQQKKKSTKPEGEKKKLDLLEAIAQITEEDLKAALTVSKSTFPDNKDLWLKDLASVLNMKLDHCAESSPVMKNKPLDFPLCHLDKKCQTLIKSVIREANVETQDHMLYHCITTLLTEMTKGNSTYGYRMFIQLLTSVKPNMALSKTKQYLELLIANQNKSQQSLAILWCLGQGGIKDFKVALRVWIELMMPMLRTKAMAPYCVEYLEMVFRNYSDIKKISGEISTREFFNLFDLIFGEHLLPTDLSSKLLTLYPMLKNIAMSSTKGAYRNVFPSFLSRATISCPKAMRTEVLASLLTCLTSDKQCYAVWCQMYTKHLSQTSVVLHHILENWSTLTSKLDRKLFLNMLRSFSITNDELASQGRNSTEGYPECVSACKELMQKLEDVGFPWFWIVFMLMSVMVAIIAYDVYTNKAVRASRTVQFLEDYGIIAFTERVYNTLSVYVNSAYSWLIVNVPVYTNKVVSAVGPYIRLAWDKAVQAFNVVAAVSSPYRQWVYLKLMEIGSKIYELSPGLWSDLGNYLWLSWDFFREYSVWIWSRVASVTVLSYKWVEKEILLGKYTPDLAQQFFRSAIAFVYNSTVSISNWCSNIIQTSVS